MNILSFKSISDARPDFEESVASRRTSTRAGCFGVTGYPVASSDLHIILVRSQLEVKATGFKTVVSKWPFEPSGTQFDDGIITSIEQESFFIAKKLLSFSKVILNLKYCPCWSQFINFKKKNTIKIDKGSTGIPMRPR
jgi:hypothetical protein